MSRIDKSDAQANAEALDRRGRTYADPNAASFRVQWDYGKRQPRDLREAERIVRRAYQDEVPAQLHERDGLADDGTPAMTAKAEAYIFGGDSWTDAGRPKCSCGGTEYPTIHADECTYYDQPLVSYYNTPFRAALDRLTQDNPERAALVRHVTLGGQTARQAAIREKVPTWAAAIVAEVVLRAFIASMTDLKVHLPKEAAAA